MNNTNSEDLLVPGKSWESFCMEDELEEYKNLLKRDLNLVKEYYENYESRINKETLTNDDNEINYNFTQSENMVDKFMEKKNFLTATIEELGAKKGFEKEHTSLHEEIENLEKTYKKLKVTLPKMKKYYETIFGCELSFKSISDELFNVCVQITNDPNSSANFTISRKEKKIIDFDASAICSDIEESDLKETFKSNNNVPLLLANLRKIVLKKVET